MATCFTRTNTNYIEPIKAQHFTRAKPIREKKKKSTESEENRYTTVKTRIASPQMLHNSNENNKFFFHIYSQTELSSLFWWFFHHFHLCINEYNYHISANNGTILSSICINIFSRLIWPKSIENGRKVLCEIEYRIQFSKIFSSAFKFWVAFGLHSFSKFKVVAMRNEVMIE